MIRQINEAEYDRREAAFQAHYNRLEWQYGPDRAKAIINGKDPATEADKALWRGLGRNNHVD